MKFSTAVNLSKEAVESPTVPGSLGNIAHDLPFETLLKIKKPLVEEITGLQLYPTYSFARIYKTGNELKKHKDRPSCEISVTLKLGDTGNYNWPICIDNNKIELATGDAVIYRGCDIEHWREKHDFTNYFLGQVFLHYVDRDGPNCNFKYDKLYHKEQFFINDITKES